MTIEEKIEKALNEIINDAMKENKDSEKDLKFAKSDIIKEQYETLCTLLTLSNMQGFEVDKYVNEIITYTTECVEKGELKRVAVYDGITSLMLCITSSNLSTEEKEKNCNKIIELMIKVKETNK